MLKISFVVPIYNDEKYLPQCLGSLCMQREPEIEFILVDDGSADNSLNICEYYEKRDSRIRVFHQSHQGANVARNKGLKEANGKWVCFIDGDDWIENNFCEQLAPYIPLSYDIIIYSFYNIHGGKKQRMKSNSKKIIFHSSDFIDLQIAALNRKGPYKYGLKCLDPVNLWNKLYRRDFLTDNQILFIPEIQKEQDEIFNLTAFQNAKTGIYINKALYNYRYNPASVTNRYQPDIAEKYCEVHKFLSKYMSNKNFNVFGNPYWERIAVHSRTCVILNYCNDKNEKKYSHRKTDFLKLLSNEPYFSAIINVKLSHFPIREMILSWSIKHRFFLMCEVLTKLQNMLNKLFVL